MAVGVSDGWNIFAIYALSLLMHTVASADPDPNPRGEGQPPNPKSAIPHQRVELVGAQPPHTPYIPGEGVNYLTPRVQFHANKCNEDRDANPQPQERNSTLTSGTNPSKRTRKSRGPSIYACTQSITIISLALYLRNMMAPL